MPPTTALRRGGRLDPLEVHELVHGTGTETPDPVEFVLSDRFLDREYLYPRQATMLKVIFLREDMFTQYDYDVVGEWGDTFRRTGDEGCQPDLLDRMRICTGEGRPWFREVVNVTGRRGGKGYLGAVCGAYVTWHYLHRTGGPQRYYGIDRDKRLSLLVFAGKKEQATANQWRDLSNVVLGAPCFAPYISRAQGQSLTLFAPTDMLRVERLAVRGVETEQDLATFEILPKESTLMAARGPAAFCMLFDEMAHVVAVGTTRSAEEVYQSAIPALDQFGHDGFIYEGSSPWQMTGQFYENWTRSLEREPDGRPAYPEMVMFQLPSWAPYEDWREAGHIPLRRPATTVIEVEAGLPGGGSQVREVEVEEPSATFPELRRAIQEFDDQMRKIQRANPETFAVERGSKWAAVIGAYLNKDRVADVFRPWGGRVLVPAERGRLSVRYKAHGDPASVDCRFGFAVGHVETVEREEVGEDGEVRVVRQDHVVFDALDKWEAGDWADRRIHYSIDDTRGEDDEGLTVEADVWDYIQRFQPDECSFDPWNSIGSVERLGSRARRAKLPKTTTVYVRQSTAALDWRRWEALKVAVNMGLVHAPSVDVHGEPLEAAEIAELELRFLTSPKPGRVDHPTSGPVTSKDIADCHDSETEVLTARGWLRFPDVRDGDLVATRTAAGELVYQTPTGRVDRHYAGPMYLYDGRRLNFCVTPGHRMLVLPRSAPDPSYRFRRADQLRSGNTYLVPTTSTVEGRPSSYVDIDAESYLGAHRDAGLRQRWTETEDAILADSYSRVSMGEILSLLPDRTRGSIYNRARTKGLTRGQIGDRHADRPPALPKVERRLFAKFLGFWLAEGRKYHTGTHRGYGVQVSQTKPEGIRWFDQLLREMQWPHTRSLRANGETVWSVPSYGLREYLRACCIDRHELVIPDDVFLFWSEEEMRALLEGLAWGDGNLCARTGEHTYYTSASRKLVDDVQRLMLHLGLSGQVRLVRAAGVEMTGIGRGYRSRNAQWGVGFGRKEFAVIKGPRLRQEHYDGMVHCLTVPNGTLLTRRRGIAMWSGNCMQEVVWYLIGDQMTAYLGKDLSEVGVRGTSLTGIHGERQPGYSATGAADRDPRNEAGSKLSELTSRGRGARAPYGAGRRRVPGRGGWGRR